MKLKGKKTDVSKISKVEVNDKSYETLITKWTTDNDKITVLKQAENGRFNAASIECKGEIKFIEEIKVPLIGDIQVPPKKIVEAPENLHWRHPFFGLQLPNEDKILDPSPSQIQIKSEFDESISRKSKKERKGRVDEVCLENGILKKVKSEPRIVETPGKKKKLKKKREAS